MLSRKQRIDTPLFKEVLKFGQNHYFNFFSVKIFKKTAQKNSRIAFVVPKKQFPKATQRNLIKRRGFNAIKDFCDFLPPAVNIIFFLKKDTEKLSFSDLKKEISSALQKIKVLNK
ncbi:MAG: ribonuclease P protein component [Patescibacteria group bacterium]